MATATAPAAATPAAPKKRQGKSRTIGAVILVIIGALLLPLAIVGFWGQRTLTDTERFVQTVGPLATQQVIQEDVATAVSNAIVKGVDLESEIAGLLPPKAAPLAGPISAAMKQFVYTVTLKIMQTPQFAKFWVGATTKLQEGVIRALSGDETGPVQMQGDQIVLDTGDLIAAVKTELAAKGLTSLANRPTPPAADREIVLLNAKQVKQAQVIYAFSVPIATWLLPLTLLLLVAAIVLARHRGRMMAVVGIIIAVVAVLLMVGLSVGDTAVTAGAADTAFAKSAALFFSILTAYLESAAWWTLTLGLVLVVIGWLISGQKQAKQLRQATRNAIKKDADESDDSTPPAPPAPPAAPPAPPAEPAPPAPPAPAPASTS